MRFDARGLWVDDPMGSTWPAPWPPNSRSHPRSLKPGSMIWAVTNRRFLLWENGERPTPELPILSSQNLSVLMSNSPSAIYATSFPNKPKTLTLSLINLTDFYSW